MDPDLLILPPHLSQLLLEQASVAWIYLTLVGCLSARIWLSLRLYVLPRCGRYGFLSRTATLAEAIANISLLLGVMGTLIGVAYAVAGQDGTISPEKFIETFSNAFAVAIGTTLAGGMTYIACLLLSSLDGLVVEGEGEQ